MRYRRYRPSHRLRLGHEFTRYAKRIERLMDGLVRYERRENRIKEGG